MKNNMKKLAAALLSGTMLLGMTGSVFAADAQTDAMSVSVTAMIRVQYSQKPGLRQKMDF